MDRSSHPADETADETVSRLLGALERYSGWLGRDRASNAVRANVQALGVAVSARSEISPCLRVLDADLQRLAGGDVRRILRKALTEISIVLEGPRPRETREKKERYL